MKNTELYLKKKRRVLGEILTEGEVKNENAWVSIHASSKDLLLTYESQGCVVSMNGGGDMGLSHPNVQEAAMVARYVVEHGGVIINGGRSSGVMKASADAASEKYLGVIFPELKGQSIKGPNMVVVNSPTPRIELLATCAPIIVIFRGGLGTFNVLMRAIVHIKNRVYHPEQLPQIVFVSNYWIGLLTSMMNLGTLPREFLSELVFFHRAEELIEHIPIVKGQKKK